MSLNIKKLKDKKNVVKYSKIKPSQTNNYYCNYKRKNVEF